MQNGDYIRDRLLPVAVRQACERQGVRYMSYSDEWVIRVDKGDKWFWIFGYKFDLNASAASHLAQDKVGTYAVLHAAGIPAVEHVLVRTVTGEAISRGSLATKFENREIVIKPLDGTGGRGVQRFNDINQALDAITQALTPAWAVSPYLNVVSETRLIVLNNEVILAYEKQNPQVQNGLRFYNLSHGAKAYNITPDYGVVEMALHTANELGLRMVAVDIVTLDSGKQMVLEVNDGFSMEYYARQSADHKARAIQLYDKVIAGMFM